MAKEFNHNSVFKGTIQITSGIPAANKVLLSDATGNASWQVIPSIALTDVNVVANQTAQLALVGQEEGDVAIRTDENKSYVHNGGTAGTMADWTELLSPTAPNTNLAVDNINTTTLDITSSTGTDTTLPAATNAAAGLATAVHITAIEANTAKVSNVSTALSVGTVDGTTVGITSDGGTDDVIIPAATTSLAGVLSGADKTIIDSVKSVQKTVTTVAGVGLDIVHNLGTTALHVTCYNSANSIMNAEVTIGNAAAQANPTTTLHVTTAVAETNMRVVISTAPNLTILP